MINHNYNNSMIKIHGRTNVDHDSPFTFENNHTLGPQKTSIISSLLGQNILLSTIFSTTLNLYSSLRMKKQNHTHTKQ
jgi:hypothetical protein